MLNGKMDPYSKKSIKILNLSQEQVVDINDYIRTDLNKQMSMEMILNKINTHFNVNLNKYAL